MLSDEEIAQRVARMRETLGPTRAGWYEEACKLEYGHRPAEALLWACRYRELAREADEVAAAAKILVNACGRLDEGDQADYAEDVAGEGGGRGAGQQFVDYGMLERSQ